MKKFISHLIVCGGIFVATLFSDFVYARRVLHEKNIPNTLNVALDNLNKSALEAGATAEINTVRYFTFEKDSYNFPGSERVILKTLLKYAKKDGFDDLHFSIVCHEYGEELTDNYNSSSCINNFQENLAIDETFKDVNFTIVKEFMQNGQRPLVDSIANEISSFVSSSYSGKYKRLVACGNVPEAYGCSEIQIDYINSHIAVIGFMFGIR